MMIKGAFAVMYRDHTWDTVEHQFQIPEGMDPYSSEAWKIAEDHANDVVGPLYWESGAIACMPWTFPLVV